VLDTPRMRRRPLGKTGFTISELGLGTWGLSGEAYGPVDARDGERVIARALDIGITLFETCDAYGGGQMEHTLGRMLEGATSSSTAVENEAVVVTRVGVDRTTEPPYKHFDRAFLEQRIEASRRRLRRDALQVVLLHNPSADALAIGEAADAMNAFCARGWVRHWGVSAGDMDVARVAIDKGAQVLEMAYNLFHARDVHVVAGDLMVSRVGLLARSVLAHGLLAGMWSKEREFAAGDHRADRWTRLELSRRVEQLSAVKYLVRGDVLTMRAAAVRFVLANPHVSAAVLGPRTEEQLTQLVRETGSGPRYLPDADLAELPKALERVGISL